VVRKLGLQNADHHLFGARIHRAHDPVEDEHSAAVPAQHGARKSQQLLLPFGKG
jgi:hypothetical protein